MKKIMTALLGCFLLGCLFGCDNDLIYEYGGSNFYTGAGEVLFIYPHKIVDNQLLVADGPDVFFAFLADTLGFVYQFPAEGPAADQVIYLKLDDWLYMIAYKGESSTNEGWHVYLQDIPWYTLLTRQEPGSWRVGTAFYFPVHLLGSLAADRYMDYDPATENVLPIDFDSLYEFYQAAGIGELLPGERILVLPVYDYTHQIPSLSKTVHIADQGDGTIRLTILGA